MINKVIYSSDRMDWETPQWLFDELNAEFHFTLDPCANEHNHKCANYFTAAEDGLSLSWKDHTVFCNPPYGKEIGKWVHKCRREYEQNKVKVVILIPARTDTKWFHDFVYQKPNTEIRFIKGRLKYGNSANNAPFPSMLVIFG